MAKKEDPKRAENPAAHSEIHHAPVAPATPEPAFADGELDVAADAAVAAIAKLPEAQQESLVLAWVAHRNAAAVDAVARDDRGPAKARKAAKRGLGVLKARGVAIPERESVTAAIPKPTFTIEARMIFPDGQGAQLWWITRVSSTGASEVVEITTHDRAGLIALERGRPTAGNLKQIWQGWIGRAGRAPATVPIEYARARIAEARALSIARKAVLPMGLTAAAELLEPAPPSAVHPIDAESLAIPTDEGAVKARLEQSMRLHEEPEFGSWLPENPSATQLLQSINDRVVPLSEADRVPEKVDPIVNTAIEEAADAYFSEERKKLFCKRLADAAWSLYQAGRIDRAIDTVLVARAIERAGVVSDRPSEIPFVRGMFLKLIAVAQQQAAASMPRANQEGARLSAEGG